MEFFAGHVAQRYPDFDQRAFETAETLIELAFAEDLGRPWPLLELDLQSGRLLLCKGSPGARLGDITSESTIPLNACGSARFVARATGVIAGLPVLHLVAHRIGLLSWLEPLIEDGGRVEPGTGIASISGEMRSLLMFERTALNFLQRLSGIATLTAHYVAEVADTKAVILDTRKTTPGWRALEKYAVRCGGGRNHRMGLYDSVLIKDNHLAWLRSEGDPIECAIKRARDSTPAGTTIEIEVDTLDQFDRALACDPDIILVDNFSSEWLAEAVKRRDFRNPRVQLEASGGITLETAGRLARTGVDRISVGALTHSAPALDIGLDFEQADS